MARWRRPLSTSGSVRGVAMDQGGGRRCGEADLKHGEARGSPESAAHGGAWAGGKLDGGSASRRVMAASSGSGDSTVHSQSSRR
jgi:hypothetical protein